MDPDLDIKGEDLAFTASTFDENGNPADDRFSKVGQGDGPTINSDIPKWRIDYVFAAGPVADWAVESRPLLERAFRLNISDKEAFALSDHFSEMAVFR